jgi:hypothetical protein
MKLTLSPEAILRARQKPEKHKLKGEPRPFTPLNIRNLTPAQHFDNGAVVSTRKQEVTKTDPLLLRIRELEAEVTRLKGILEELL